MANSIGNAALILSTNGTGLVSGLADTAKGIKAWSDKVQTSIATGFTKSVAAVNNFLGNAKSIFAGAGSAIGMAIGGPLGGAIGNAVGSAAGDIVSTIYGAVTQPFDKLKLFSGIQKQASALGVSASEFQGFSSILERFGVDGDAASGIFAKMGHSIHDLSNSKEGAFALQRLGLTVEQLSGMSLDQQFKTFADAIKKLPPGAEQATVAMQLFGRSGYQLLPMLQKGSKGIEEMIAEGRAMGSILSDSQIAAAAKANKAWKDSQRVISQTWDGLVNRATLIAAPIVQFIGGVVGKAFRLLTPVFDWLGRAIETASVILEAVFEVFGGWLDEAIGWVKNLITAVFKFGDSWPSIEGVVLGVFKAIGVGAGYVWDTIKAGAGAIAWVASFVVDGFGRIVDAFKETIKDLLNLAGKLPDELGGAKFREMANGVDEWGGKIKTAAADMKKWGEGAMNTWGDSAKRIGEWFDKLSLKRKEAEKAKDNLNKDDERKAPDYKAVAGLLKGSKEAYSVEARFMWDSKFAPKKPDEKVEAAIKLGNDLLKQINQKLGLSIPLVAG